MDLAAETASNAPGMPPILEASYSWPGSDVTMTIAEAVPRWIVTTGCTYAEALARCGVSYRTAERWMYTGGAAHRDVADGSLSVETLDAFTLRSLRFFEAVAAACAEVVVRWQSILELEGRGGFPITRTTTKVKTNAAGDVLETVTETVTETARPNVDVVMWKMRKQLDPYREKPLIFVGSSPLEIPEPTEVEVATAAVASLERYRESIAEKRKQTAIETSAVER